MGISSCDNLLNCLGEISYVHIGNQTAHQSSIKKQGTLLKRKDGKRKGGNDLKTAETGIFCLHDKLTGMHSK